MRDYQFKAPAIIAALALSILFPSTPSFAQENSASSWEMVAPVVRSADAKVGIESEDAAARKRKRKAGELNDQAVKLINNRSNEEAIELLEAALMITPENNRIKGNLAIAYNNCAMKHLDDKQKALSLFRKALFFDPENQTTADNLGTLLKSTGRDPKDFATRIALANECLSAGDEPSAIVEYWEALRLKLDSSTALKIGDLFYKQGALKQAADAYRKAALYENANGPYVKYGQCLLESRDIPKAIDCFKKVLARNPDDVAAQAGLVSAWEAAVRNSPSAADNHIGLAQALILSKRYDRARAELQEAFKLSPGKPIELADKLLKNLNQKSADMTMPDYLQYLTRKVRRNWFPPKDGAPCTCLFEILKDGNVAGCHVIKSSGSNFCDKAGLRAIEKASPFSPLPGGAPESLCIEFRFDYNVKGNPEYAKIVPRASVMRYLNTSSAAQAPKTKDP